VAPNVKKAANDAMRRSLERGFNARLNVAAKRARVSEVEDYAYGDLHQTAPQALPEIFASAVRERLRKVRRDKFGGATLTIIRRDIRAFVKEVQANASTRADQRAGVRALMEKHGDKVIQFPSEDYSETWCARLRHIKVSKEGNTEWTRAIKLRGNGIHDDVNAQETMEEFGNIASSFSNGVPIEFGQI
jgi:hypothetical protein